MTSNFFVTGTDTGVGKTLVTALLALRLQARGVDVGVMKPFASGCEQVNGELESEDARWLKEVTGVEDELELINPARWEEPLAPLVAAQRAGDSSDYWHTCLEAYRVLSARHACVIVEGVGGLLVPIYESNNQIRTCVEWATTLALPTVVVGRRALGTINHSLLTHEVLCRRKINCHGFVFSSAEPINEEDTAAKTSPQVIAEIAGLATLGEVPFLPDLSREALQRAAEEYLSWP